MHKFKLEPQTCEREYRQPINPLVRSSEMMASVPVKYN